MKRIVYLGGLHPSGGELSEHLASRTEVGEILLASRVPTAVLQAAVIIGSGSASFEMLRYLTERLPAMVTPRWVRNRIQPIAVRDVLRYLVGCARLPDNVHRAFDGYEWAVELALAKVRHADVETRWSTAAIADAPATPLPSDPFPTDPEWSGGSVYVDRRTKRTTADPASLWRVVNGIGGENGWYSFPLAWAVRGWLDRLVGGVGLRRGRRSPTSLYVGEALDFWRVEEIEPGTLLRLRAEMKVPGRAWLEMSVEPDGEGARLCQRAVFLPRGLAGHVYRWSVAPFHGIVFGGMVRNIVRAAERYAGERTAADATTARGPGASEVS